MAPLVSIIVPAYNREEHIGSTLDSIEAQHVDDYEVLVVDDRSTDRTRQIVTERTALNERIRYLHNDYHQGPGGARNFGIDNTTGRWIAWLDSDDRWLANHLEPSLAILDSYPAATGIFSNRLTVTETGKPLRNLFDDANLLDRVATEQLDATLYQPTESLAPYLLDSFFIQTQCLIVRRDWLGAVRYDETYPVFQDHEFAYRLTSREDGIWLIRDEITAHIVRHNNNLSIDSSRTAIRYGEATLRWYDSLLASDSLPDHHRTMIEREYVRRTRGLPYHWRRVGNYSQAVAAIASHGQRHSLGWVVSESLKTWLHPLLRSKPIEPTNGSNGSSVAR